MLEVSRNETVRSSTAIQQSSNKALPSYAVLMSFGQRLKDRRADMRLTGTELGMRLSPPVSKQTIAHWESERYNPNVVQIAQLCRILNISADALVMGVTPGFSPRATEIATMFDALSPESRIHWGPILSTMDTQKHLLTETLQAKDVVKRQDRQAKSGMSLAATGPGASKTTVVQTRLAGKSKAQNASHKAKRV